MKERVTHTAYRYIFAIILTTLIFGKSNVLKAQTPDIGEWSQEFILPGIGGGNAEITLSTDYGLFIGGNFQNVDGVDAKGIAFWDGTEWSPLGEGLSSSKNEKVIVYDLIVDDDKLYVGGKFTHAGGTEVNNIAVWNIESETWSALGEGINGDQSEVYTMTKVDNKLYVGGSFTEAGSTSVENIAYWDGNQWLAMNLGLSKSSLAKVKKVFEHNGSILAGGSFTNSGKTPIKNLAIWDGSSWAEFGGGTDRDVNEITTVKNSLIIGGNFREVGSQELKYIAIWNGRNWMGFDSHPVGSVNAIKESGNGFWMAGSFYNIGIYDASGIAYYNGSNWQIPQRSITSGAVNSITEYNSDFVFVGTFNRVDSEALNKIGVINSTLEIEPFTTSENYKGIDGSQYIVSGDVIDAGIYKIVDTDYGTFVAGNFFTAGDKTTQSLAKWNDNDWEILDKKLDLFAKTLLADGDELYLGGWFTKIGDEEYNHIAVYNIKTNTWNGLGDGLDGVVNSILKFGSKIYASGKFNYSGDDNTPLNGVASWNGSNWVPLGSGLPEGEAYSLIEYNGNLIAGGDFDNYGNGELQGLAIWNGTTWKPLKGGGLNGIVNSLAIDDDGKLIAGGSFTETEEGAIEVNGIARWDGNTWEAMGSGFVGSVNDIKIIDGSIIAAGDFKNSGIIELNGIATWDSENKTWQPLGSINNPNNEEVNIRTIEYSSDGYIFVGGEFQKLGGYPASNITRFNANGKPPVSSEVQPEIVSEFSLHQNYPNPFNPTTNITYELPKQSAVNLTVFNMLGQEVAVLVNGVQTPGKHTITFDATALSSGMYFYKLTAGNTVLNRKMVLLK